jgi:hypothetical protein
MAEMNESMRNALGLATGIAFGALLQRAGWPIRARSSAS